ncbi:MAG: helix-turn-helix domain-containing protein [Hyphomicrobiaceae bacterium]
MKQTTSADSRDHALGLIRTAMIEKKLTQAELADEADCHEKTIQNLMGGRSVRDQTLFDVCTVLSLDFLVVKEAWSGAQQDVSSQPMDLKGEGGVVAPVYMGAYTRAGVDHYIGNYLTLRPAFSMDDTIVAYRTDIVWDPEWPSLLFEERDRPDATYSHRGRLYLPASSMFIHLVSLTKGAMRMVMVSQLDQRGFMRGLITTLNKQGAINLPVSAPIVYTRQENFAPEHLGIIKPDNAVYSDYRKMLDDTVKDGYAKVVSL